MIRSTDINQILGITENYQLCDRLMEILMDNQKREEIFDQFMTIEPDLTYDWFTNYFQETQSNRSTLMQDYTPDCVCKLVSLIAGPTKAVYDQCCGIGGLSISLWKERQDRLFHFEELSDVSVSMLLFNVAIRNMNAVVIHGDVLTGRNKAVYRVYASYKYSKIYTDNTLYIRNMDTVVSNPPYSLKWDDVDRYRTEDAFVKYALVPKSKADYAFVLRGLDTLNEDGTAVYILPHGVLFRGAGEGDIRRQLVNSKHIYAVIGLPEKLFFNTSIPVCILVLKKRRDTNDVLFIDAAKLYEKDGKQNIMTPYQIREIMGAYAIRRNVDKLSHLATLEEIKENGYNLNIPRYVDTSEEAESIDFSQTVKDMEEIEEEIAKTSDELKAMMTDIVGSEAYERDRNEFIEYLSTKAYDIVSTAMNEVSKFIERNQAMFSKQKVVKFDEVASIERSRKDVIYPAGSILIQLSASKGQLIYMKNKRAVDSKYGVITCHDIEPDYFYTVLQEVLPAFLETYQTGLNIVPDIFHELKVTIHTVKDVRRFVTEFATISDRLEKISEREIEKYKVAKQYHLENMFPKEVTE